MEEPGALHQRDHDHHALVGSEVESQIIEVVAGGGGGVVLGCRPARGQEEEQAPGDREEEQAKQGQEEELAKVAQALENEDCVILG